MQSSQISQSQETSTAAGRSVKGKSPQPATTPTGRGRHNQSSFSLGEDVSITEVKGRSSSSQKATSTSQISLDSSKVESSASTREMASSLRQADALDLRGGAKAETLHGATHTQGASHSSHMSGSQDEYRKWSAHHQQHSEQRRVSSSTATTSSRSEQRTTSRGRGNASSITFHSEYDPWRDATITRRGEWQIVTPCPASLLETRASSYKSTHESKDHKFYLPVVE